MLVQIDFDDPYLVSQGDLNDQCKVQLCDTSQIVSELSGEPLPKENSKVFAPIPRQLPHGVKEEEVQQQANSFAAATNAVGFAQFFLQHCTT